MHFSILILKLDENDCSFLIQPDLEKSGGFYEHFRVPQWNLFLYTSPPPSTWIRIEDQTDFDVMYVKINRRTYSIYSSICIPKISTCIKYCEFFSSSTSDQGRRVILVLRFIMMRPIRKWFSMYLLILKKGPTFQKGLSHFLNVLKNYAEMK